MVASMVADLVVYWDKMMAMMRVNLIVNLSVIAMGDERVAEKDNKLVPVTALQLDSK